MNKLINVKLPTKYVFTIDIGKEIASAKVNLQNPLNIAYIEKSPLLVRKDGRVYDDFREHEAYELVYGWIHERWDIIQPNYGVAVEPQMSLPSQGNDRMCIILANTFYSILNTLHAQGLGPPCIFIPPTWWRKAAGAEADRKGNMQEQYKANKARSVTRFTELYGQGFIDNIRSNYLNGGDYHDIPEAVLMGYALAQFPEYIDEKLRTTSHHHGTIQAPGKPVRKEQRLVPILPVKTLAMGLDPALPANYLLKANRDYRDLLFVKKTLAKSKKAEKHAEKEAGRMGVPKMTMIGLNSVPGGASSGGGGGGKGGVSFKSANKRVKRS